MQDKRFIISHSGKQHSYHVAKALHELGYLKAFYTSSYIANFSLQNFIQKKGWSFLSRRFLQGLGGQYVKAAWRYEIKEQFFRKLKGNTQAVNELVYKRDISFDSNLARKLSKFSFDVFWGFQGSCRKSLEAASNIGKPGICEMTIAHLPFAKRVLDEEAALHPEWADSIDFTSFPAYYEQRLIEEPLIANKVIAISSFLKQTLVQEGVNAEKVTVIPLGFDTRLIKFTEQNASITNRPLRLLYVGRITQRKGIKYLLEAIKQFDKKDVELHIIGNVYGSGKAFQAYNDHYYYTPGVSQHELFNLYGNYDVLVFPSILEGFGLVTVEAMGAGLPVITTPHTNATEVIEDSKNGYVVPVRNIDSIVKAITTIRNMDDSCFQQMRLNARQTALKYTWDAHRQNVGMFIADKFPFM